MKLYFLEYGIKVARSWFIILYAQHRGEIKPKIKEKNSTTAGFEPAREDPNGFQVHRLNHSATLSSR